MTPGTLQRRAWQAVSVALLAAFTVFAAFPFYWMLVTAFKQTADLMNRQSNPFVFNLPPTLEHIQGLFYDTLYGRWLFNTALVGGLVGGGTLRLALPAGYAPAR